MKIKDRLNLGVGLSIEFLQRKYDSGSDEIRSFIESIVPKWELETDFNDFSDVVGYGYFPDEDELDRVVNVEIIKAKRFIDMLEKDIYAHDGNCTDLVYDEAQKLNGDEIIVALWHQPRDDYTPDYIKGFIKLHKREMK